MTDVLETTLTDMASNGPALARIDGQVLFADFGIPGERVRVAIERRKKDYLAGRVIEAIDPDPSRIEPACQYFGQCGGCQWQHMTYERQLDLKTQIVRDQFRRIAKMADAPVRGILPSPNPWKYRNHARFTVNEAGELGFNVRGTNQFLRVDACPISDPRINSVLSQAQGHCAGMKSLEVRVGVHTGDLLVWPRIDGVGADLSTGQQSFEEELRGIRFRISHDAFFQVNTPIAGVLFDLVEEAMALKGGEQIVDAFAGVGTFACLLAATAGHVVAIEESAAAVHDAVANLASAGITNVEMRPGRVEDMLPGIHGPIDAILIDPPRTGCDRRVVADMIEHGPSRIVYVSCDPATLARDVRLFVDGGYALDWIQPVDQFPQTYHIEAVVRLSKTGSIRS